jgi:DNA-directed RNA polymerase subunit M/transcription elongation factor TFIIS
MLLMRRLDDQDMTVSTVETCEHTWRYYVDVATKAVRARECERCGARKEMTGAAALPVEPARQEVRLSA